LILGVSAVPAPIDPPDESGLPPVLLQAASPRASSAAAVNAPAVRRGDLTVILLSLVWPVYLIGLLERST
jgi:hypothetical protein